MRTEERQRYHLMLYCCIARLQPVAGWIFWLSDCLFLKTFTFIIKPTQNLSGSVTEPNLSTQPGRPTLSFRRVFSLPAALRAAQAARIQFTQKPILRFSPRRDDMLHRWGETHQCNDKCVGPKNWNFYSDLTKMWNINVSLARFSQNLQSLYPISGCVRR